MGFFPLKKIAALAAGQPVYLRGVRAYNAGCVQAFTEGKNAFYPDYVTAGVADGDDALHVEVGFDAAGEAEYLECACGHAREGRACAHIVAVLVAKYYRDMVESLPTAAQLMRRTPPTDPAAQRLIDSYMTAATQADEAVPAEGCTQPGTVTLQPTLSLFSGEPRVTFTIGAGRRYTLKRLARFVQDMATGATAEYGRQLCLTHREEAFAPAGLPLLRFLLDEYDIGAARHGQPNELCLSPAGLDRFFIAAEQTQQSCPVTVRSPLGEQRVRLVQGDPVLSVTVDRDGDGARLFPEAFASAEGQRVLYVLHRGTLYRTGAEYRRRMADWTRTMRTAGDGLFIAAAQLPAFCTGVLPAVRPFIQTDGDAEILTMHAPRRLTAEVILDAPEPDTVTGELLFRYPDPDGGEDTVLRPFLDAGDEGAPWRDTLAETRVRAAVQRQFTLLRPQSGTLVLRGDDERLFAFCTRGVEELRRVATVYATDAFERLTPQDAPSIRIGVSLLDGLLQMDLSTDGEEAPDLTGIIEGYRQKKPFHRLPDGRFVRLDDGLLGDIAMMADTLGLTERELSGGRISLPRYRALYLEMLLRAHGDAEVRRDAHFAGLIERFDAAVNAAWALPQGLQGVLRPYQEAGYRWLRTLEALGFGGILADDMGLGKTVQIIALLQSAKEESTGGGRPSLVVCPTSLVLGWERELRRFAPGLTAMCVTGSAATRQERLRTGAGTDVLITSYDMLKRDVEQYADIPLRYLILDEAQYIKNSATQNARAAKVLQAEQRFALTGTPVENRLGELWSIFDFLMPGLLFGYKRFRERFELPIVRQNDERALGQLSRMVSPFILRRLKSDVLTELPPKTERVLPAEMGDAQRAVYQAAVHELRQTLLSSRDGRLSGQGRITVLAMLTRLRQICCDPRLCCEGYTGNSAKLEACVELLREAASGGHKVLLFSQFTSMLDLLADRLRTEGLPYYMLIGSTPAAQRAALVDAFNTDDTPVFLISLKAGGTGLNLVGADMVIHYDPWWNLAAQNQATDRAYRIGQRSPVQVVRLIARDTLEERIVQMQEDKWQLARSVVEGDRVDLAAMSAEELLALLR